MLWTNLCMTLYLRLDTSIISPCLSSYPLTCHSLQAGNLPHTCSYTQAKSWYKRAILYQHYINSSKLVKNSSKTRSTKLYVLYLSSIKTNINHSQLWLQIYVCWHKCIICIIFQPQNTFTFILICNVNSTVFKIIALINCIKGLTRIDFSRI